jgi:hypothetical protein
MREWCRRDDFHHHLPRLLQGEDPDFVIYLRRLSEQERNVAAEQGKSNP